MGIGVDTDQTAYEQDVKLSQLNRIMDAQQGMLVDICSTNPVMT